VTALALAFLAASQARAATFVSSRPQVVSNTQTQTALPPGVPVGAIVLKGDPDVLQTQQQTRTCAQVYGVPAAPLVSYSGGPWTEVRMETAYQQYTAWTKESGECYRNYQASRTVTSTACPPNQSGVITYYQQRNWTLNDAGATTSDTGYVNKSSSSTCNYYFTGSYGYDTSNSGACGTAIQQRSYQIWSDGSRRNYSGWYVIGYNAACVYYVRTETLQQNGPNLCTGYDQSGTEYYIQQRSYEVWSDGSIRNDTGWHNVQLVNHCTTYAQSCFTQGSMVLMADGTWREISTISSGDWVMGAFGEAVQIERLHRTWLGNRKLLCFEDESLFWSDEHTFWTRKGGAGGKQWFWTGCWESWCEEVAFDQSEWPGLYDNGSIFTDPPQTLEFATIHGHDGFERKRVKTAKRENKGDLPLFLPLTVGGVPIIVNGYVVGSGANERTCDYTKIDWTESVRKVRATMVQANEQMCEAQ